MNTYTCVCGGGVPFEARGVASLRVGVVGGWEHTIWVLGIKSSAKAVNTITVAPSPRPLVLFLLLNADFLIQPFRVIVELAEPNSRPLAVSFTVFFPVPS